jgi:hypothetical protein
MNPEVHHSIGKFKASPEHIGLFVKNYNGDPSVKVKDLQSHNVLHSLALELYSQVEKTFTAPYSISAW